MRALIASILRQNPAVLQRVNAEAAALPEVVDPKVRAWAAVRQWWRARSRPGQRTPQTPWRLFYCMGARGSGKTMAGAAWLADNVERYPGRDWAIVAPIGPTAWDACVEGESGLLPELRRRGLVNADTARSSRGRLILPGGGHVFVDGADDGALTIQSKNLAGCWADEVGLWRVRQWRKAWLESILPAVRIAPAPGVKASIFATGTPKRGHPLVRWLLDNANWVRHMVMAENAHNLAADVLEELIKAYKGTSLEDQELRGRYITDVPGALWKLDQLDAYRVTAPTPAMIAADPKLTLAPVPLVRIVVALDPSVTNTATSDECGIVAVGLGADGHGYVLGDWSGKYHPADWARKAVEVFHLLRADRIIGEANNGGDLIETVLRTIDRNVPYSKVHASHGKRTRAEPIAALAEQGRIHHVGRFEHLEDQLTGWDGSGPSPDRLDALTWAASFLMLKSKSPNLYFLD